ncbi:MAG: hypothetical protein GY820_05450, partial [Gammaproteobacteria bacterium]|nr:hypothetical protein [Gammaproteobacteria bacterium]
SFTVSCYVAAPHEIGIFRHRIYLGGDYSGGRRQRREFSSSEIERAWSKTQIPITFSWPRQSWPEKMPAPQISTAFT